VPGERVVVIGGGIVGASVALHLAEGGADVLVVDDARPGRATYAGAGIVAPPWRSPGSPIFELRAHAVAAYPELAARIGAPFEVIGELFAAPPGPALDETSEALAASGLGPEVLEPEAARAAFPYLAPHLAAARVGTTARVEGDRIRDGLLDAARRAGAEVVTGAAQVLLGAGRVDGVEVDGRRHEASTVVVAAGAWSAELVAAAGHRLAVAPQKGQILHLGVAEDTASLPVVQPIGADHYLLPFSDRRVVVGATRETGSGFDLRLTAGGVLEVLADALSVAPGLATADIRDRRVGLRPLSADGEPLLGPVPGTAGLWVASGMGPQGLTIGPYSGRLVAEAVLGRDSEVDIRPFAVDRPLA